MSSKKEITVEKKLNYLLDRYMKSGIAEGKTWGMLKKHIDNFYQENKNEKLDVDNLGYAKELMLKAPEDLQPKIEASLNACKNNGRTN